MGVPVALSDQRSSARKIILDLLIRVWTGAGFLTALFALFLLLTSQLDFFELSQMLSSPLVLIFYGYGSFCALVIEGLSLKLPQIGGPIKFILYAAAGCGFFFVQGINPYSIIAGFIGAVSALVFWAGTVFARGNRTFRVMFAVIAPLLLLFVLQWDLTTKRGWLESTGPASYTASFDFFHGEHAVPVTVEKGQTVHFEVNFDQGNHGGQGLYVSSDHRSKVPMQNDNNNRLSFLAERSGVYRIMVTGDRLRGSFNVDWEIR